MAVIEPETRHDRVVVVREAGVGRISLVSVLAGVLVAYGMFAVVAAVVAAVLDAANVETEFGTYDWEAVSGVGTAALAVSLLVSYLFGGYVAGRMARRSGL